GSPCPWSRGGWPPSSSRRRWGRRRRSSGATSRRPRRSAPDWPDAEAPWHTARSVNLERIEVQFDGPVARIWLNRPSARNAFDGPVAALVTQCGFTEVRLGILPAVISPYVIGKIGESAARELFLTGERFEAVRALEIGLVRAAVPEADLDAAIEGRVQELLKAGPRAVAEAKALIREVAFRRVEDVQRYTVERIAEV